MFVAAVSPGGCGGILLSISEYISRGNGCSMLCLSQICFKDARGRIHDIIVLLIVDVTNLVAQTVTKCSQLDYIVDLEESIE